MKERQLGVMLGAHLVALPICCGTLLVAIVVTLRIALGPMDDDDPGGPLFLPILALLCIATAVALSLALATVSCVLQMLLWWQRLPGWGPLAAALPAALVMTSPIILWEPFGTVGWSMFSVATAVVFALYWSVLWASQAVLWRICKPCVPSP